MMAAKKTTKAEQRIFHQFFVAASVRGETLFFSTSAESHLPSIIACSLSHFNSSSRSLRGIRNVENLFRPKKKPLAIALGKRQPLFKSNSSQKPLDPTSYPPLPFKKKRGRK